VVFARNQSAAGFPQRIFSAIAEISIDKKFRLASIGGQMWVKVAISE
jgi:hypothetical protein